MRNIFFENHNPRPDVLGKNFALRRMRIEVVNRNKGVISSTAERVLHTSDACSRANDERGVMQVRVTQPEKHSDLEIRASFEKFYFM